MNRAKLKSVAGAALLASLTAIVSGCYYYGYDDRRDYYARRDWRYDRYYDRRYDARYNRDYDRRYGYWHYHRADRDRYYDNRTARVWRENRENYSD
jgi:hypothetical protein